TQGAVAEGQAAAALLLVEQAVRLGGDGVGEQVVVGGDGVAEHGGPRRGSGRSGAEGQIKDLVAELVRPAGAGDELEFGGQFVDVPLRGHDENAQDVPAGGQVIGK